MSKFILILSLCLFLLSCSQDKDTGNDLPEKVTDARYRAFLDPVEEATTIPSVISDLPQSIPGLQKLATSYIRMFEATGKVSHLNKAVNIYEELSERIFVKREKHLRVLAQAYIKQHRFREADSVMIASRKISDSRQNRYVAFDVAMELGRYEEAAGLLEGLRQHNDREYLVRAAKWADYQGKLFHTINIMEQVKDLAEAEGNPGKLVWVYTNLGDYYGHDNQLKRSYEYYLKALEIDSANYYSLRKIAYILFAHEKNYNGALELLSVVNKRQLTPDALLQKAEILDAVEEKKEAEKVFVEFKNMLQKEEYGDMYNGYLISYYLDVENNYEAALLLSEKELTNRSTPETWTWRANALLASGRSKEALTVVETYVKDKTGEPLSLLTLAKVYKASEMEEKAGEYRQELESAAFELGPQNMKEVAALYK